MRNSDKLLNQFNIMMLYLRTLAQKQEGTVKSFREYCWNQRCEFIHWAMDNLDQDGGTAAAGMCAGMSLNGKRTWMTAHRELVAITQSGRTYLDVVLNMELVGELSKVTTKTPPKPLIPSDRYSAMVHCGVTDTDGMEKDREEWTKVIHWCRTSFHAARQERIWTPAVKAILDQWDNAIASLALIAEVDMGPLYLEHEKAKASFDEEYANA